MRNKSFIQLNVNEDIYTDTYMVGKEHNWSTSIRLILAMSIFILLFVVYDASLN